jgi:hypothetical protein
MVRKHETVVLMYSRATQDTYIEFVDLRLAHCLVRCLSHRGPLIKGSLGRACGGHESIKQMTPHKTSTWPPVGILIKSKGTKRSPPLTLLTKGQD